MIEEIEAICWVNESVSGTFHLERIKMYKFRKIILKMTIWQMKRVALGKSKILLRNGANILKIIIYERFILNFSILGLIFHNLSKKCLNRFTDAITH
jgi:hypothetical protein